MTTTHASKKHNEEKPSCMLCQMCHNTDEKSSSIVVAHCDDNSKLKVRVLLDTGALQGNYISLKIARRLGGSLLREKAEYKESEKFKLVCSLIN